MARPTKEERLQTIHREAMAQFDRTQSAVRDERIQSLADRRFTFIPGAQWEGPLGEQFENKPKFEINKALLAIMRIYSEYRNNRITVDFVPKDGAENDKLAETCDGLYRADEQDSCADEAYDNAFEEGVAGGMGAWRLRACYEDEYDDENERQRIRFEPIYDADSSVFFDLDAKKQNKSDAKWGLCLYSMDRQSYIDEYGDDPSTWPKEISMLEFDWATPDVVYVAEYYRVEEKRETVHTFTDVTSKEEKYTDEELIELSETEEIDGSVEAGIAQLEALGSVKVRDKRVKRRKVRKYIMSGSRILEDCGYIAGKYIPLIPSYGKRFFIDNVERFMGNTRPAKDVIRLKNMQLSKLAEISALSSVEKPIVTPDQIAGHQLMWSEDNLKNYPYLLINPVEGADGSMQAMPPISYTRSPQIPAAMAALLQITDQDMNDLLGNQQAGEQIVSNISGKAVEMIQQRLDMQTFIYMSNFAKAMQWCGTVWLSMAQEIYSERGRKMKKLGAMGEMGSVELGKPMIDEETGATLYENDLSKANFDVAVDVGPSFTSRRDATVRSITGLMQMTQDPTDIKVLSAMAIMNMDGEGLDDLKDYYRKQLVGLGALKPNEEEQAQMEAAAQQQQPDPQAQYLEAAAAEASARARKAQADTGLAVAKTEETRANTVKALADADATQRDSAIKAAQAIGEALSPAEPPAA